MSENNKNSTHIQKKWHQFVAQNGQPLLPVINKEDFEEAVDLLVGMGLSQLYNVFLYEPTDEKRKNLYMDLKIKAFNALLQTKRVLLSEKQYTDTLKHKEIKIPQEYKVGNSKQQ